MNACMLDAASTGNLCVSKTSVLTEQMDCVVFGSGILLFCPIKLFTVPGFMITKCLPGADIQYMIGVECWVLSIEASTNTCHTCRTFLNLSGNNNY
jgi:hypothetical protein